MLTDLVKGDPEMVDLFDIVDCIFQFLIQVLGGGQVFLDNDLYGNPKGCIQPDGLQEARHCQVSDLGIEM